MSRDPEAARPGRGRRPRRGGGRRGRRRGPDLAVLRAARAASLITPSFPEELPVSARREEIAELIRDHQVVVIAGETGSGKTTQIPKICLELGRGVEGLIGHTQPRRIAARTVADRISEELGTAPGTTIGHQVRFTSDLAPETRVKLMTDGILLAEVQHDRDLRAYDTIIIDEAHERSLNIDFLIGYLKTLLPRRPDLKVIITSATIDPEQFAAHFDDAPIIRVSGRTYPVEMRYRPLQAPAPDTDDEAGPGERSDDRDQLDGILDATAELLREPDGDILIFLSGEREIRDTKEALESWLPARGVRAARYEVLPMFSRLSNAEQHRIFQPGSRPRIVLATNVAETSVTVPGITYVIDPGTARISRFSTRTKVQRLPIEPISRASADQRAGRCGRTRDGICIRLYDAEDYEARPRYTDPEVLRTNLANVVLTMATLGFADDDAAIEAFPFLTSPPVRAIRDGRALLGELGALVSGAGGRNHLSKRGRSIARIPLDPRLAGMILAGAERECASEVIVIVAAMSIQDPRERPLEQEAEAKGLHRRFDDPTSDFLALLNLWTYLEGLRSELGSSQFRKRCRREHLNYVRIREWQDLVGQLRAMMRGEGMALGELRWTFAGAGEEASEEKSPVDRGRGAVHPHAKAVHLSLLSGLLSHIGARTPDERGYLGARGTRFAVFPGSALFRKPPPLIMAAELVETTRLWARMNARLDPEWVEEVAGDLLKRRLTEPHWSAKRSEACAYETTSLYGVTLVSGRRVGLARFDPEQAREIFLRAGIVEGGWRARHPFLARNARVIAEIEELGARTRRAGLVDDEVIMAFYQARIPAEIATVAAFDAWWKHERRANPQLLDLSAGDLLPEDESADDAAFPRSWPLPDGTDAEIAYAFDPGSTRDGVTVRIPVTALNQVEEEVFSWQVPGLRDELAVALLRSLPKNLRRNFVPAPDVASEVLDTLEPYRGDLREALAAGLSLRTGQGGDAVTVEASDFDTSRLPAHLRLRFAVVDDRGAIMAEGEELALLRDDSAEEVATTISRAANAFERADLRDWDFAELPETFAGNSGGRPVTGYPALRVTGDRVDLTVLDRPEAAAAASWAGVRRLLLHRVSDPVPVLAHHLTTQEKLLFGTRPGGAAGVLGDVALATIDRIMVEQGLDPDAEVVQVRDAEAFDRLALAVRDRILDAGVEVLALTHRVFATAGEVSRAVSRASSLTLLAQLSDITDHQARLLGEGFLARTGWRRLQHLPRYVQADLSRLGKLADNPARDRSLMDRVHAQEAAWDKAVARLRPGMPPGPALEDVRWMIEELRVSLFAQELGTPMPISEQRIAKALAKARSR